MSWRFPNGYWVFALPALLPLLPLLGCASVEPEWYRLAVVPGPARPVAALHIDLREVALTSSLDRSGMVRAAGDVRLTVSESQRWAAPLGDMVTEVLAQDLELRLPGGDVRRDRAILMGAAEADAVVDVALDRFEADADGHAALSARITLRRVGAAAPQMTRVDVILPSGGSADALAMALSRALGELADRLAGDLAQQPLHLSTMSDAR